MIVKTYKQGKLDVTITPTFTSGDRLANAVSYEMQLISPTGRFSTVSATLTTDRRSLFHRFLPGELAEYGRYTIYARITFDNGRDCFTTPDYIILEIPGNTL